MKYLKHINIGAVAQLSNEKHGLNYAAITYAVKDTFGSSAIPEYNHNKIAKLLKCSHNTAKNAVNYGIKNGLCKFHGKTLIFDKLKVKSGFNRGMDIGNIPSSEFSTLKRAIKTLRLLLIGDLSRRQESVRHMFLEHEKIKDIKTIKALRKMNNKRAKVVANDDDILLSKCCGSEEDYYGIGYNRIAKELSCCKSTAFRFVKQNVGGLLTKVTQSPLKRVNDGKPLLKGDIKNIPLIEKVYYQYLVALNTNQPIPNGVYICGKYFYYQPANSYHLRLRPSGNNFKVR
jgi:hypothetical protein